MSRRSKRNRSRAQAAQKTVLQILLQKKGLDNQHSKPAKGGKTTKLVFLICTISSVIGYTAIYSLWPKIMVEPATYRSTIDPQYSTFQIDNQSVWAASDIQYSFHTYKIVHADGNVESDNDSDRQAITELAPSEKTTIDFKKLVFFKPHSLITMAIVRVDLDYYYPLKFWGRCSMKTTFQARSTADGSIVWTHLSNSEAAALQ